MTDALIAEFTREAAMTRRVLERVPESQLSWAPHARSMSLGQLSLHIAGVPAGIAMLLRDAVAQLPTVPLTEATSVDEILSALTRTEDVVTTALAGWGEDGLREQWTLMSGDEVVVSTPRVEMVRTLMLNHWYHHRGQLTVYLRLLDVPLPAVYGPSADED